VAVGFTEAPKVGYDDAMVRSQQRYDIAVVGGIAGSPVQQYDGGRLAAGLAGVGVGQPEAVDWLGVRHARSIRVVPGIARIAVAGGRSALC
jgi:hypothetical protein